MHLNTLMETTFLFASPSFLSGVARVLNLGCQFDNYNESKTVEEADAVALYSDFRIVGQDLQEAMELFVVTNPKIGPKQLLLAFESVDSLTKLTKTTQHAS